MIIQRIQSKFYTFINRYSMGQTQNEKVIEVTRELQAQGSISSKQLQAFLKDIQQGLTMIEVQRFMETPSMEIFLLEVIKRRYEAELMRCNGSQPINFKDPNRQILIAQATALFDKTIQNMVTRINGNWKSISQKMCGLYLSNEKQVNIQHSLWKIVGEALCAQWMEISETVGKVKEDSQQLHNLEGQSQSLVVLQETKALRPSNTEGKKSQFNLASNIINCRQCQCSQEYYPWRIQAFTSHGSIEAIFYCTNSELADFLNGLTKKKHKLYIVLKEQFIRVSSFIKDSNISSHQKKWKILTKIFNLLRVFLTIIRKFMQQKISQAISEAALNLNFKLNVDCIIRETTEQLKFETQKIITTKIEKLKQYSIYMKNSKISSLFFDENETLQFICSPFQDSRIIAYLISTQQQKALKEIRLFTLFSENKKLKEKLSAASKGLIDRKTSFDTADGTFIFVPGQLGKVSHIIMQTNKDKEIEINSYRTLTTSKINSPRKQNTPPLLKPPKSFAIELQQLSINLLKGKNEKNKADNQGYQKFTSDQMLENTLNIFSKHSFYKKLSLTCKQRFKNFVEQIIMKTEEGKHTLLNFTRTLHSLIWIQDLLSFQSFSLLESIDVFCVLLSTLAKNLHTESTLNSIECQKKSAIAEFFNHHLPIQNSCARIFFEILSRPSCNFLTELQVRQFRNIRTQVIENILSIDEEMGNNPFYLQKPKTNEMQKITKSLWKCLFLNCSRFSIFASDLLFGNKWIPALNEYLLQLKSQIFPGKDQSYRKFFNKHNYLKQNVLPAFIELHQQLQKQRQNYPSVYIMFEKIDKNIQNLRKLCDNTPSQLLLKENKSPVKQKHNESKKLLINKQKKS